MSRRATCLRAIVGVLAALVWLWVAAPMAAGQGPTASPANEVTPEPVAVDEDQMVDPEAVATPPPADPGTGDEDPAAEATVTPAEAGAGNAALQTRHEKREEAEEGCAFDPPRTNHMLAIGGSVGNDGGGSFPALAFLIAGAAAALAVGAYAVRRRRASRRQEPRVPRGVLEVAGAVVALCSGLAGLAVLFVPSLAAEERPPPEARMEVRDVQPRVTRGEFARALRARRPRSEYDRREVGNVVWLQLRLSGYAGKRLTLQWGAYGAGGALVAASEREMTVRVQSASDVQTIFQPVWVGHPETQKFTVEFRLLDETEVREMAATDEMRALKYRYSCDE